MKVSYRGFNIEVKRERCMAGYALTYFSVERQSDGWFMVDEFADTADSVRDMVGYMKQRVDGYHTNPAGECAPAC